MPAAARMGDDHRCHQKEPVPHEGGVLLSGCESVLIGEEPAARVGDEAWCEGDGYDVIVTGERTVLIGGAPAARLGDATAGGNIMTGDTTVQIGPHPMIEMLREASAAGLPFCEKYVRTTVKGR